MENEDKLRKIAVALGIAAVLLGGVLAYVWVTKNNIVKDLNIEKADLTQEMMELRAEYAELQTANDTLNANLEIEREKVDQLIERFKETEATNRAQIRQYEKELGTLRSIMRHYIVQIDSLNNLNIALRQEASDARQEAAENRRQYDNLRTEADELGRQVAEGSVVKGRGVSLHAINSSAKETDRSSRTEKLRTDLFLIENSIAKKGPKRVYIRIKGPDGILMTADDRQLFNCAGEEMIYSESREVDYQGEEVEISVYFASDQPFVKGVYTVDAYTTEGKLGSADLLLK
jgi:DNA repair exonuclease SbcCD ATPase subunit